MTARLLAGTLLLLTTAAAAASPVTPGALAGGQLDSLVARALHEHPALAAATADSQAAAAGVRAAGSLPDPLLAWGEMLEPVETRVGPQERVLGLQQRIPWPGTLGARREAAAARTTAAAAAWRATAVDVAAGVRRAWARAAWLAGSRRVVDAQRDLARSLEASARAAYETGQGTYADLLQAQVEVSRLDDRRRDLDDRLAAARARLTAAVGLDQGAAIDVPLDLPAPAALPDAAASAAGSAHPLLAVQSARARAAAAEARAARRSGLPALTLGVDWIQVGEARRDGVAGSGDDALVGRLGLSLPIWRGKHDGAAAAAEARARAALATRRARDQDLAAGVAEADANLAAARRTHRLYADDLVPRARQAHEAVTAAYETGQATLAEVIAVQRTLLDLELTLLAARRDLLVAAADRDAALGMVPGASDGE
jgi:outer membrane protein TolC